MAEATAVVVEVDAMPADGEEVRRGAGATVEDREELPYNVESPITGKRCDERASCFLRIRR